MGGSIVPVHAQTLTNQTGAFPQATHLPPSAPSLASSPAVYDEQLGLTFTQSFTSMDYNVTAVEQQDSSSGYGPAYLLNGLSNNGYWYQVGLTWNWCGPVSGTCTGYTAGFNMVYEVFNPSGNSIFPADGGGFLRYSGTVNQGDEVILNLYFSGGNVIMLSRDTNTGASASISYSAEGATTFVGLDSYSNSNGFFTGLMTEQYHPNPYYGGGQEVNYTDNAFPLTSGLMWIDEYAPSNLSWNGAFFQGSPITQYSPNPKQLQTFSSNGATEYSDGYTFITGDIPTTTTTITLLPAGQSTPLSAMNEFAVSYSLNGVQSTAYISTGFLTVDSDADTMVTIAGTSTGSSSSEEWVLDSQASSVTILAGSSATYYYYDLVTEPANYIILGGGNPTAPTLSYSTAPTNPSSQLYPTPAVVALSSITQQTVWALRESSISINNPISGGSGEQWSAQTAQWIISLPDSIPSPIVYYHQFYVTIGYSTIGGGSGYGAPAVSCTQFGAQISVLVGSSLWADAGSFCTYSQILPGSSSNEEWAAPLLGPQVTGPGLISQTYNHQYTLALDYAISGGGSPEEPFLTVNSSGIVSKAEYGPGATVWLDAGSQYSLSNPLPSPLSSEMWLTASTTSGVMDGPEAFSATYYNQYLISATFDLVGGGTPLAPVFYYTSLGNPTSIQLTTSPQSFWADSGSRYSAPSQLNGMASTERWSSSSNSGTIQDSTSIVFTYNHQFLLSITGGGLSSRWYNASSIATLSVSGVSNRTSGTGQRVASYSLNGTSPIVVQPTTGAILLSVVMNAARTLTISSVNQYQVSLDSSAAKALASITPPTISGDDYWYDQGTPVSVILNGIWNRSSGTGDRLTSFAINRASTNTSTTGQIDALVLSAISSPQAVTGVITTQYQLNTDSGSIVSITAPPILGDTGWYDAGTTVAVSYSYSWNSASSLSRTNAIGYAIGQNAAITLKRSGNGTFVVQVAMSAPSGIAVQSVVQYRLTLSGDYDVVLSASSPTSDSFYDSGSVLTASTDYTWGIVNGGTRQNLISYTLDGTLTNVTRSASGNFTTPSITFSAPYTLTFNAVTQDLVDFQFKDSTGTDTIVPALVQIQIDDPTIVNVPPTGVWLDSGTKFQFYDVEWESSDVKPTNQTVYTVDAPSNQTVLDRVYNGNVVATDYLGLPVSGAKVTVALANGTTITATTGSNGSVALREIPIGTFTATIRYLGTTTSVSGNAATESTTQAKVLASYPTFGIIAALLVVGVAASLTVVRRRHHAQRISTSPLVQGLGPICRYCGSNRSHTTCGNHPWSGGVLRPLERLESLDFAKPDKYWRNYPK